MKKQGTIVSFAWKNMKTLAGVVLQILFLANLSFAETKPLDEDSVSHLDESVVFMQELNEKLLDLEKEAESRPLSLEEIGFLGRVQQHITDMNAHIEIYNDQDLIPEQQEKVDTLWALNQSNFDLWEKLSANVQESVAALEEENEEGSDSIEKMFEEECGKLADEKSRTACLSYRDRLQ